ncbi:MAG: flagellar protein FlaG [Deferribacteraceae bacterium]|jgi:flagellar protein FlaG|nr:flagellar protein FlaG [Deferribacteraceae bacterium]
MNQVNLVLNNCNTASTQSTTGRLSETPTEQTNLCDVDKLSINNAALTVLRREERQFMVDEDLERLVVKIIDADTKELIRQIPTEDALKLSKKMQEMIGLLFN